MSNTNQNSKDGNQSKKTNDIEANLNNSNNFNDNTINSIQNAITNNIIITLL